jgi:uncharacterized membrane protein YheB (UPF0754 family)
MSLWLFTIPLISAFIGYFTNWVAIKMLFHPKEPVNILGLTIQGIFPKRQQQFGEKLGKLVSTEFLGFTDIEKKISDPKNLEKLMPAVEVHIDQFLQHKLPQAFPMIAMFIGEKTIATLKTAFMEELSGIFPTLMQRYANVLQEELDIEKIVVNKVSRLSSEKLEDLLYQIMAREFRFVELIGGVLGFLIGLFQVGITLLAN